MTNSIFSIKSHDFVTTSVAGFDLKVKFHEAWHRDGWHDWYYDAWHDEREEIDIPEKDFPDTWTVSENTYLHEEVEVTSKGEFDIFMSKLKTAKKAVDDHLARLADTIMRVRLVIPVNVELDEFGPVKVHHSMKGQPNYWIVTADWLETPFRFWKLTDIYTLSKTKSEYDAKVKAAAEARKVALEEASKTEAFKLIRRLSWYNKIDFYKEQFYDEYQFDYDREPSEMVVDYEKTVKQLQELCVLTGLDIFKRTELGKLFKGEPDWTLKVKADHIMAQTNARLQGKAQKAILANCEKIVGWFDHKPVLDIATVIYYFQSDFSKNSGLDKDSVIEIMRGIVR